MKSSQLYLIITQLGTIEHRSLGQFVRSPYHNRRPELVSFCDLLIKSAQTKDQIPNTRAYYFRKVFPGQPYDDKKMRYTISFLNKLVKRFLAIEQLKEDQIWEQRLVAKAFKKKGLSTIYEKEIQNCLKLLEKKTFRNPQYYLDSYLIGYEDYETFYKSKKSASKIGEILPKLNQSADIYMIATTLKLGCSWLSLRIKEQPEQYKILLLKTLGLIEKEEYFQRFPVVMLYYNAYQMLSQTNQDQFFDNFKLSIEESGDQFQQEELSELYVLAVNHCIRQANQNKEKYRKELFEIYKKGLSAEAFFDNEKLSGKTYINIVQAGLNQEAYDWVAAFIEKFKPFLKKNIQEEFYLFNLANYHNKRKNYDQVMEILRSITFSETMMEMSARRMLLKIYYDMGEAEALYSLFDSFKNYIYRQKELSHYKNHYLNLIKFTKKLFTYHSNDHQILEKLRSDILQTDDIIEKNWLLERWTLLK